MTIGRDRYLAERVATASPEQLIMMLFDRAVAELHLAHQALTEGDRLAASPRLRKAQDIVGELRCSLDLDVGEIEAAGGVVVHPHAVDQDERVVRLATAQEDAGQRAGACGADDLDAGHRAQHVVDVERAQAVDLVGGEHGHRATDGASR